MIVTDKEQLKQKCEPCKSVEEGEEIAVTIIFYLFFFSYTL
jgi:hypothetical protein